MLAKDYRAEARSAMAGSWGSAVWMTILFLVLTSLGGIFSLIPQEIVASLCSIAYSFCVFFVVIWAYGVAFYKKSEGIAPLGAARLFDGYGNFGKVLGLELLSTIYIMLWSCLFVIPGIVKFYSYAMAPFILQDNPDIKVNEAINQSKEMMNGHKSELFCLHFSFIGWYIVGAITLGIAMLWITPYVSAAEAEFYRNLKRGMKEE